jgi:hypothetical protein
MKTYFEQIIIDNIDLESYNLDNDVSLYDKIKTTYNIFKREYIHEGNEHLRESAVFKEWLQGLPSVLTVPFYNAEILAIAYLHEMIKANASEEDEDKFLEQYFEKLASAFFTLKENL